VLKNGLTEEEYFRLRVLEKDFPGIELQRIPKRHYPQGKVGSHLIGYLGAMQKERYDKIINDIRELSEYIRQIELGLDVEPPLGIESLPDAKRKLFKFQERAYTLNDALGVTGVEASFEDQLRGYAGKRIYFSDAKGNFVREMPGSHPPLSGKRLLLSISIELQEFAEKLIAQSENDRELGHLRDKNHQKEPWMRGGAIVALDPNSGDIVAMASYPRFDPNDFVERDNDAKVQRSMENEAFLAKVWNQSLPLAREYIEDATKTVWKTEEMQLTWKKYLQLLLPVGSPILQHLSPETPIQDLIVLQRAFDEVLKRAPTLSPLEAIKLLSEESQEPDRRLFQEDIAPYQAILNRWFSTLTTPLEKLLLLDLSRLVLCHEDFPSSSELIHAVGALTIDEFRTLSCEYVQVLDRERKKVRTVFHNEFFAAWRKTHEKEFLQAKRIEERQKKRQARPYLDYLDKWEKVHFDEFWKKERCEYVVKALSSKESLLQKEVLSLDETLRVPFLRALKGFYDLEYPLYIKYRGLSGGQAKDLAAVFVKTASASPLRSYAFRQSTIQGSIFKLVTAYAGLKQKYLDLEGQCTANDLKLFEIHDHTFKSNGKLCVGNFPDGRPIPQLYKGGRIPKSLHHDLGNLDITRAIETSSNPYFSLLAGDFLRDPEELAKVAREFGYGEKTGAKIPGEIAGNIPNDLATNRTGLYATAIGQHTLITTPLQTAVMLSAIANGGKIVEPKIATLIAGHEVCFEKKENDPTKEFLFKKSLAAVGVDFPLFSAKSSSESKTEVSYFPAKVKREIFLPDQVRSMILEGMRRSVQRALDDQGALPRLYAVHPAMHKAFTGLKGQFVGKTSTAEVIERVGFDVTNPLKMYRHIWFGGISFSKGNSGKAPHHSFLFSDPFGTPELVVVVYLRYGGYGKEAAPIAAQVVQKWREINQSR
ncbi:MAG: pbp2, partial [Chlamydiia bacterium]|nr:pbp2 [Chlamydiia bacterium]